MSVSKSNESMITLSIDVMGSDNGAIIVINGADLIAESINVKFIFNLTFARYRRDRPALHTVLSDPPRLKESIVNHSCREGRVGKKRNSQTGLRQGCSKNRSRMLRPLSPRPHDPNTEY